MSDVKLPIIGSTEFASICGRKNVPAKIDTGADFSTIWASDVEIMKDGTLRFKLFGPGSQFYTGKVIKRKFSDYGVSLVRSSNGQEQLRFKTRISLKIAGKIIRATFTLSDRSQNNFPILIGRTTLNKKFLVDVSRTAISRLSKGPKTALFQAELEKSPYDFYQKYVKLAEKGA